MILNTNDNALSLLFFANAPMSDYEIRECAYLSPRGIASKFKKIF